MVYGVYRRDPMQRCGIIRSLLLPDRLLLAELSVHGQFLYVPRALRYRRVTERATLARQRASLFGGPAPAYARLPWWLVHTAAFARSTPPGAGRAALVATHARGNFTFAMRSRTGRVIDWGGRVVRRGLVWTAAVMRGSERG
jgi:hypothetical protein